MTTNLIKNNTNYNKIEQIQTDIANIKIKETIGKLDKGHINTDGISTLIENQLLDVKNILKQPKYSESYKNISPLFENEKKFEALQILFEFEFNQAMNIQKTYDGITPQEALNIIYDVVPEVVVNSDGKVDASATSKAIGKQHGNLDPLKKELNDLMDIYAKSVKQGSIIQELMLLLFDKIIKMLKNRELRKTYKEELRKKDNNDHSNLNLNDEHYNLLNDQDDPDYAIIEETLTKAGQQNAQQKLSQSYDESDYVSAEEVRQLKKQQRAAAEGLKTEYQMVYNAPQHLQIHDLPQPQRAQISEKPKVAPKPSKEVIERALSNSANQQNRPKELNIPKVQPNNRKLGHNIEGLINKIGNKIPMNSPDTSPKQSPTSSKKSFTMFKNSDTKNEAPKVQETKQSVFYNTVNNGVPIPPPMPTEDDLRKVKLTSGKERDTTSQVNPKKRTIIGDKATEGTSVNWNQALSESDLFKKRKANIEEDKPQAELKGPNIEHVKNTLAIGR